MAVLGLYILHLYIRTVATVKLRALQSILVFPLSDQAWRLHGTGVSDIICSFLSRGIGPHDGQKLSWFKPVGNSDSRCRSLAHSPVFTVFVLLLDKNLKNAKHL